MSSASHDRFAPTPRPAWSGDAPVSVRDCVAAFEGTEPLTVGVEEELMLLSPETLDLEPAVERVLERAGGDSRLRRELRAAQVEVVTPVCRSAHEAGLQLADGRAALIAATVGETLVAAAGTHPFSTSWGDLAEGTRYRALGEEYAWAAKRSIACGLHVHVAVGSASRALAVFNALRSYVPELVALAANSPFHEGRDTGLASVRPKLNEAFPREGIPPAFGSWDEFVDLVVWGRQGGSFPDASFLWWELRPNPTLGTVEVRAPDAQTSVEDAAAVAAVVQSLVAFLADRHDAGEALPVHESFRISENLWSALRFGLSGWLGDLETGEPEPTRARLGRLLEEIAPAARALGCDSELTYARTLLGGNGAERQRYVAERDGIDGLVRWLVAETAP